MNTTDHWDDLKAAGQVPPPSPEVLAHARRQLDAAQRRRRPMLAVVAAAAATAAVVGVIAVHQAGGPTAVPAASPSKGQASYGVASDCAVTYTPAELKKRAFAFEGTVVSIDQVPGVVRPDYLLTFEVSEWFKPTEGGRTVSVRTSTPPKESGYYVSTEFPDYSVGSRLLISGETRSGGTNPMKDAIAFGCGFSRPYNQTDAGTWRKAFAK